MAACIFLLVLLAIATAFAIRFYQDKKAFEVAKAAEEARIKEKEEYKSKCVTMVKDGASLRQVSREMNVPYSSLRNWVRKS